MFIYEFKCPHCMHTFKKNRNDCDISYDRNYEIRIYLCSHCGYSVMESDAIKWYGVPETDDEMRKEYNYYLAYYNAMYGSDYRFVSYEKFKKDYPTWKPANQLQYVRGVRIG